MANLFNRLSTKSVNVEQNSSELEIEKKINVLDVVKNSNAIHKIQEASQTTKENLSQVDRTTVINKATSLDYDKIIKGVGAVGVFLKPARAISPIVFIFHRSNFSRVLRPTINKSFAGKHHTFCLKLSGVITVMPFGFFMSEPSFANILLKLTPMLTVNPTSFTTLALILRANASASSKLCT